MALIPADIATVSHLLDEALALPANERDAWLAALPSGHQRHAQALREMLAEATNLDADSRLAAMPTLPLDEAFAHAYDRVGPYRLLQEIGRGGMGSVWLAERADGAFQRQVALKLPRLAWGVGLAERMAREREIGARLEHPSIARLYDAGVDGQGRPYLALEYVDGQPIDAWCEAQALDVPARLQLFVQVVKALAYAHSRLVVHRDLKPSNVLVTPDGQAHLLDFGIAKLLQDEAPGPGLTQEQGRVLTPHYASPEQVAGEAITVQSDVYSLGVLLYELVTGTLPIEPKRGTLGALEDAILAGEAPPASCRVKDRAAARALRGEIDAILSMAMRREPERRYATADALALDLERQLRGDTVAARPDSLGYRTRKAVQRHWVSVAAAVAVALAIVTGSAMAVVQARRANIEAEQARLVKEFVLDMFDTKAGPDGALSQMPAQALLERAAQTMDPKFRRQPLLQAELYGAVRQMFSNLARYESAVDYGRRQVETLNAAGASNRLLALATLHLAGDLASLDRTDDARLQFQRARELAAGDPDLLVQAHTGLATTHLKAGNAQQEIQAAEDLMSRAAVAPTTLARALVAKGALVASAGRLEESMPTFDEAIRVGLSAEGPLSRIAMDARTSLASRLATMGKAQAATPYLAAATAAMRLMGGPDDARAAHEEARFAYWFHAYGAEPFSEVSALFERSRAALRAQTWPMPRNVVTEVDVRYGAALISWGDVGAGYALVEPAAREWLGLTQRAVSDAEIRFILSDAAAQSGHADESLEVARGLIDAVKGTWPNGAMAWPYSALVRAQMHAQRYAQAASSLAEGDALVMGSKWTAPRGSEALRAELALAEGDPAKAIEWTQSLDAARHTGPEHAARWLLRAAGLCAAGRRQEGLDIFGNWIHRFAATRHEASPAVAHWRARQGLCALAQGAAAQAREAARLASAAIVRQPGVSAHLKAPVLELERALGLRPRSH